MAGVRDCEQCGTAFRPLREHERFCSPACRIAWNSRAAGGQQAREAALAWSVAAMSDTTRRLAGAGALDLPHALALIGEAVWWVTIVDATMIRYHREGYDRALALFDPAARQAVEGTFAGLRFVRNQMGYHIDPASFLEPRPGSGGTGTGPVAGWTWKQVPAPPPGRASPRSRAWVASRYREYRTQLAGRQVGEVIAHATCFLSQLHGSLASELLEAPAIGE